MTETKEIANIITNRGFWRIQLQPEKFIPERLSIEGCKEVIEKNRVNYRGFSFPEIQNSEVTIGENYLQGILSAGRYHQLWRFYQSGQFYFLCSLWEDYEAQTGSEITLDILSALYTMTEAYEFAARLALHNVFGDKIVIKAKLGNMKDRKLVIRQSGRWLDKDYKMAINEAEHSQTCSTTELYSQSGYHAITHLVWFLKRFGLMAPHVPSMLRQDQEKFVKGLV